MDLIGSRIVAAELVSIIVCIIIGYGNRFEAKKRTTRGNVYFAMLVTNFIGMTFDFLSWELEELGFFDGFLYICNMVSVLMTLVLLGLYNVYVSVMIREKTKQRSRLGRTAIHLCFFLAAVTLVMYVFGDVMVPENGAYISGPLYPVYLVCNALSMIITAVVVIINRRVLGKHDFIVLFVYMLIPTLSVAISLFVEGFDYGYVASTLSLLEFYIFIQSEENSALKAEGQTNRYYATHDELTGLLSRRAFSEKIKDISVKEGNLGVIYCDLNGLKYANDHFGHAAGDKLLVDFAEDIRRHFPLDYVYRMGGDEFLIFVIGTDKASFDKKVNDFERSLVYESGDEKACIGDEFGSCAKAEDLVQMAENKMYRVKEDYHRRYPEKKRF